MYAAIHAQIKLKQQIPTDIKSGAPKLCVFSYTKGVIKLFKALPS
jgi:hypothetical protein